MKDYQIEIITETRRLYDLQAESTANALELAKQLDDTAETYGEETKIFYRVVHNTRKPAVN